MFNAFGTFCKVSEDCARFAIGLERLVKAVRVANAAPSRSKPSQAFQNFPKPSQSVLGVGGWALVDRNMLRGGLEGV